MKENTTDSLKLCDFKVKNILMEACIFAPMNRIRTVVFQVGKLLLFWLAIFHIGRCFFSIHNWGKFSTISFSEWFMAFIYSFRLDLATAALLSILPLFLLASYLFNSSNILWKTFKIVLFLEVIMVVLINAGEINAYPEWNHKLTTRVFNHLMHPDEVVRTADYSMTIWFFIYALLELVVAFFLLKKLFVNNKEVGFEKWYVNGISSLSTFAVFGFTFLILGRGGVQPIPINIDAAYYSKNYVANDLSVNSTYFFAKSLMLYNKSELGGQFPRVNEKEAKITLDDFYHYETKHSNYIFTEQRPNFVFLIMESWTANAISSITGEPGATPYFDALTKEGLLFTHLYSTGGTSEIGNSSIFSGYPALPEISISMQPDKHRKLPSFNQSLKQWNYSSHYLFSGDLKYGNIGGYFVDHGFDVVEDENDFPAGLQRGKLNYYDEDLYELLLKKIRKIKGPFLYGAFTGSTHSPYDYPDRQTKKWQGAEPEFMSSLFYADKCLFDFLKKSKKEKWYKNTIFVIVADHGHASAKLQDPNLTGYFHVPLLIFGEPLKAQYRGKKIDHLGSQADIVRTLLYQLGGDYEKYHWSKDLLNPNSPQFALHTINRGFGWISPKGNFSFNMDANSFPDNTFDATQLKKERKRCHAYMSLIYNEYTKF